MSRSRRGGRPDGRPPITPEGRGRHQQLVDAAVLDVTSALTPKVLSPKLADEAARLAVGHAMRILPGLADAVLGVAPTAGPREVHGDAVVVSSGDDPFGRDTLLLDVSRTILLDEVMVCEVEVGTVDALPDPARRAFLVQQSGALTGTRGAERATVGVVGDLDALAALLAEILALAERAGLFADVWALTERRLRGMPQPTPPTTKES